MAPNSGDEGLSRGIRSVTGSQNWTQQQRSAAALVLLFFTRMCALVGDKLQSASKLLVAVCQPFQQRLLLLYLQLSTCLLVLRSTIVACGQRARESAAPGLGAQPAKSNSQSCE